MDLLRQSLRSCELDFSRIKALFETRCRASCERRAGRNQAKSAFQNECQYALSLVLMKPPALLLLASLLSASVGCALLDSSEPDRPHTEQARIMLTESIEGIKPGDTTKEVEHAFGPPSAIGYGDYAGFTYQYGNGSKTAKPTEIEILFAEEYEDRLLWMIVRSPYPGKTEEDIGIGSHKQEVRRLLGQPDFEQIQPRWQSLGRPWFRGDVYTGGDSVAFVFRYDQGGLVDQIDMLRLAI